MYVALYIRVSHEEQVKFGLSIEAQEKALVEYCNENKYKYDIYKDEGISAKSMNRPSLKSLLNNINKYDMVLFTKLDRLSRNVLDANIINETLLKNNVSMKAIQEDDIDTSTADGKFIFNLKTSLAERELGKTSERIKAVFEYKVKYLHEVISGTKKYGYDIVNKKFVINEEEAKKIKELFNYYNDCGCARKTHQWWVNNGYSNERYQTLRDRLSDIKFTGRFEYNNDIIEDYYPRIIDDDLFYSVQELLKKNKRTLKKENHYIFSSLCVCSVCNNKMVAHNNKVNTYYRCSRNIKNIDCSNHKYINEKDLEKKVLAELPILLTKLEKQQLKIESKPIKDTTPKIKEKIKKLQELYINNLIEINDYKDKYNELNQELIRVQNTLKNAFKTQNNSILNIVGKNYLDIYNKLDNEHKNLFFKRIFDKIILDEESNIKICFKIN